MSSVRAGPCRVPEPAPATGLLHAAVDTTIENDGSISFTVGVFASKPGPFPPLVEHDAHSYESEHPLN